MTCIDLTSKRSKMFSYVAKHSIQNYKTAKLQNHRLRSKTIKLHRLDGKTQNNKLQKWSKSNDLHRFYVKTIKMLSYVAKHSKQRKTTKPIKLQWIASIGCQNDQNNAKLQKQSNYNDLHALYVKTIKTKLNYKSDQNPMTCIDVKTIKTKLNYKSDQNPMTCIDVKTIKNVQFVAKHSKLRKTTKPIKLHWIASIGW